MQSRHIYSNDVQEQHHAPCLTGRSGQSALPGSTTGFLLGLLVHRMIWAASIKKKLKQRSQPDTNFIKRRGILSNSFSYSRLQSILQRFPEIGVPPPQIIHFSRIFPYKPSIFGIPPFQETPIQSVNISLEATCPSTQDYKVKFLILRQTSGPSTVTKFSSFLENGPRMDTARG